MSSVRVILVLLLLFLTALPLTGTAQAQEPGDFVLGETSVVVPANGEATLRFQTFCLDFGKEFPTTLGTPDGRAENEVLTVVRAAIEEGIADSDPLALQLAIWSVREDKPIDTLYPNETIAAESDAQALLDASDSVTVSPIRTDRGISLDKAVADGTIVATSTDFRFVETDMARPDDIPYHGEGTLILRNTTNEAVEVYFPFGTVFRATDETEQDIVAYATELEQLATATPAPTMTSVPTITPIPTVTAAPVVPTPGTVPQTGATDVGSPSMPWFLIGVGFVMLLAAGFVMVRYETNLQQPDD